MASCGAVPASPAVEPPAQPEAVSLLGRPLFQPELSDVFRQRQENLLAEALAALEAEPEDADALIWLGRRNAYLGRYREAVALFGQGIEQHPGDARMLRHRGHRFITLRQFEDAVADLERAAALIAGKPDQVEPDGLPNERGIPTSTLQSNIWYHLGLAHYLLGDFEAALRAYRSCLEVSKNSDMLVATSHWLYMTSRRLGRDGEAAKLLEPISAELDVIENQSYHRLLLMYKGKIEAEALLREAAGEGGDGIELPTLGYGVGNWHLYNGRPERAREIFQSIVDSKEASWAAFGFIAAEAELAREE